MKNKILKIVGVFVLLVLAVLIVAPFFLKGKIVDLIKINVNKNVNATFDFSDADLSLLKSFPNAEIRLDDIILINKAPFKGDTLFAAKQLSLVIGIPELFKGAGEPIGVKDITLNEALVAIQVDTEGNANYDIALETTEPDVNDGQAQTQDGFVFNLASYAINNSKFSYYDKGAKIYFQLLDMSHSGTGDLSLAQSKLDTHTKALVSLEMDSTNYLNKNKIQLDALLGIDLTTNTYSFLENKALLNQLPLVFDGFVKLNEENQEIAINFKTASSDFKNFLGVIPEAYSKDIQEVTTTGAFTISGAFKGIVDETHIPKFNIAINSDDASFKYPALPKTVRNIFMDIAITNTTGLVEDTAVSIKKTSFQIDDDTFSLTSQIGQLMGNTKVSAQVAGKMNLANLEKAYPIPAGMHLKGMLDADISTAFDLAMIENKQYERTRTEGKMRLNNFVYDAEDMANPVLLDAVSVTFNPRTVSLNEFKGKTGTTDFKINGTINNFLGYLFNDEKVLGDFNLNSDTFNLNDFMVVDTPAKPNDSKGANKTEVSTPEADGSTEKIKIPAFLDVVFNASATKVVYDNITLKNVKGTLKIADETATLSNMTSSVFDGILAFNGKVSTKDAAPTFSMNLGMKEMQIAETFKSVSLFKALAPIAQVLQGLFNSEMSLSGNLKDDFTPNLLSLSGDVLANLMTKEIKPENAPVLSALGDKLNFIDLKQLDLKELKTKLSFKEGLVSVKPFKINYKDIAINISGTHNFDQKLDYKAAMEVPAKYLGADVNNFIAKLNDPAMQNISIPVTASIGGLFSNPQVTTDLSSSVQRLTSDLVRIQKTKLLNKTKAQARDFLGDYLGDNSEGDSLSDKSSLKKSANNILGSILSDSDGKDTVLLKRDSTATPKSSKVEDTAKEILGGIFGKKK